MFFVSVASKGFSQTISFLFATLARISISVGEEVVSPCALGGCGQRLPTWMQKRTTFAEDNPAAAGRFVQKILRAVDLPKQNPAMGRAGRVAGARELVVSETPYIIPYRVRGDAMEILRVFHAAGKWPGKF